MTIADDAPAIHLSDWIGRSERRSDTIAAAPLSGLAATLDCPDDLDPVQGAVIPLLGHWLYFQPQAMQSQLGPDGHAERGGFLPPVPLPRRMWAGGRVEFLHDLHVGDEVERRSRITRVEPKEGRSGSLVFVTVHHEISDAKGVAITEEHDIVYRSKPGPDALPVVPDKAPVDEAFRREIVPDPLLLFRYSALTFNGHRIHYDRKYVTEVEGYPGLIVHGPLIATLLLDLVRRELPGAHVRGFAYKAANPLFDIEPFTVCGRREPDGHVALWARAASGALAMHARAQLA